MQVRGGGREPRERGDDVFHPFLRVDPADEQQDPRGSRQTVLKTEGRGQPGPASRGDFGGGGGTTPLGSTLMGAAKPSPRSCAASSSVKAKIPEARSRFGRENARM